MAHNKQKLERTWVSKIEKRLKRTGGPRPCPQSDAALRELLRELKI